MIKSRYNKQAKYTDSRSGYQTLLFDFDGTLVDTIPQIIESFQYLHITLLGKRGNDEQILSTIGKPLEHSLDAFAPELREEAMEIYRKHNKSLMQIGTAIFIGIPNMLQQLKRNGVHIGIVTSKRFDSAYQTAKQFGLDQYCDVFVTKESTLEHKPHPAPILKAISELQLKYPDDHRINRENILFIGDSVHDLLCARNAKIDVGIVDWTRMDKEELRQEFPKYWINKPEEILSLAKI